MKTVVFCLIPTATRLCKLRLLRWTMSVKSARQRRPNLKTEFVIRRAVKKDGFVPSFFTGSPTETRTPDSALRGLRLNRLTMRPRRANAFLSANTRAYLLDFAACRSFSQKIFAAQIFFGSPFFNAPPFSRRNLFWLHYFITIGKVFASVLIQ